MTFQLYLTSLINSKVRVGKTNAHRHRSLNTHHAIRAMVMARLARAGRREVDGGARSAAVTPVLRVAELRAAEAGGDGAVIVVTDVKNNSMRQS